MDISFDRAGLEAVMTNFYNLTKIRIVIYNDKFEKILSVPEYDCDFCTVLRSSVLNNLCTDCDKRARSECLKTNSIYIYTCHAGLYEAISPIKMNGIILGYIMLGQIIDKTEKKKKQNEILSYAKEYTKTDLEKAYSCLTTKSKKQIEAAANIMEACACYFWANRLVKVNEECLSALISRYINNNLTNDLSAEALCGYFGISRNKLYKISRDSFGMGIAAYVRSQRVQNASRMLKSGCTVADAAISAGFADYNYFSEIFKKETGVLPSKYKREHQERAQNKR